MHNFLKLSLFHDIFKDDPGSESRLQAKDGCLGYFTSKGWEPKTNFVLEFKADLVSKEYNMKGNIFETKFVSGEKVDIYIPEAALYNSKAFKRHFDKQCIEIKMILVGISEKSWSDLIRKSGVAFAMSTRYKKMYMVEMLGLQSHTVVSKDIFISNLLLNFIFRIPATPEPGDGSMDLEAFLRLMEQLTMIPFIFGENF